MILEPQNFVKEDKMKKYEVEEWLEEPMDLEDRLQALFDMHDQLTDDFLDLDEMAKSLGQNYEFIG